MALYRQLTTAFAYATCQVAGSPKAGVAGSNPSGGTATREMMRDVFNRSILTAAAMAIAALGLAAPVHADPQCPASGCPHGPANNAPGPADNPPSANVNSPSYKDGYKSEHDYFSTPQNRAYLASEMKNGYTAATACQTEIRGGSPPANENDWLSGCVDALHDLGFKP
jgi:hypothetical protein